MIDAKVEKELLNTMPNQDVQNFQDWFKDQFGKELAKEQALEKMLALTGMMKIVYTSITEDELKGLQRWREDRKLTTKVDDDEQN